MEIPVTCALTILLFFVEMNSVDCRKEPSNTDTSKSDVGQKRPFRTPENKPSRCSYTFIVPQQKLTGAVCVSTESARANRSETAALRALLDRQQEQLDRIRGQLEQEGALANEMRVLRRESVSMNARITQLYAQLLNEIIQKKDQALEQRRLESLVLNATSQVLQVSSSYRDLEKKYDMLTSLVSNQSQLITHLEKQCQLKDSTKAQQVATSLPVQQSNGLVNVNSEPKHITSNVQRDQSAPLPQEQRWQESLQIFDDSPSSPTDTPFFSYPVTTSPGPWQDCQHVLESGEMTSGIYLVRPRNTNRLLQAWCDQSRAQGGWTIIQRRQDGSVNFFRTWEQYKQGFGNLDGEYWLGLEHLYWLTSQATYKLRVSMEDWQGRQVFAEYNSFRVEPESDWYRLRLGHYQGNAGDSLSWHNNKAFTTLDRDKDAYSGNCAHYQKGGWWYHMCAHSNLNGVWYRGGHYRSRYQDGVYWAEFHGGSYSLKRVAMMIKPV
ncbi:angiopoietin-related protein 6 [Myxocyprinus asiaticus]|uniref:angiopoietin-related protein 6 n=1 Tax=Myxocyprinus asiaticus TaxID=70543 RepID=UPI002222DC5B|nr:angiopoietin-related protein 6 [Myxocyprinus asiaticus]XP_051569582.1 angiopoietin-related protein 6 [Myxocyprinus asiaticus]XP_051569583.1 angiopoietin-related protein 6 [Myxocyprinus asiaticus]